MTLAHEKAREAILDRWPGSLTWSLDFILEATGSFARDLNTKVLYANLHFKKVTSERRVKMAAYVNATHLLPQPPQNYN